MKGEAAPERGGYAYPLRRRNDRSLPGDWSGPAFLRFFEDVAEPSPSPDAVERMARLFRAAERGFGPMAASDARRIAGLSPLRANRVLRALRDPASIPRRQLETPERRAALAIMRSHTPVRHLVPRHTRELLHRYHEKGLLATPIAERRVEDRFVEMTVDERALYDAVEDYIATTYNQAAADECTAVGFVMTIYRRRLASSFQALRTTLERHLGAVAAAGDSVVGADASDASATLFTILDEDVSDDETSDEAREVDEVAALEQQALAFEEAADIQGLLDGIRRLPPDGKVQELRRVVRELRREGFTQAMVFTQYTDTMDFLREELGAWDVGATEATAGPQPTDRHAGALRLMCFSGRGGEVRSAGGAWTTIGRDEVKRRFREGEADLLLCTDAAAEGLNFQFCGALINYDMPWNPMRVEQRIGRIDRLGQAHPAIRIVNLHYAGTVETDVYRALRTRINLFESVVGPLQPILARLPRTIAGAVLTGDRRRGERTGPATDGGPVSDVGARPQVIEAIERQVREARAGGFDIDATLDADISMPARAPSPVAMEDLDRVITAPDLMPPGTDIQPMGQREYGLLAPGMGERLRVTTNPEYYEKHADSVELWSPGNPLFKRPDLVTEVKEDEFPQGTTLKDLLDR